MGFVDLPADVLDLDEDVSGKILRVSAATIDRMLGGTSATARRGRNGTKPEAS